MANSRPIHGHRAANSWPIQAIHRQFMSIDRPSNEDRKPNASNGQQPIEPTESKPAINQHTMHNKRTLTKTLNH
eukprot:2790989-Lingulodinium_polyedra.AAC.1